MGLFSSKKKTVVGTTVSRVFNDAALPDSAKTAVLRAIMKSQSMTNHILEASTNSIGVRADRMFSYGAASYPFGLPSGKTISNSIGEGELQVILDSLEGSPVSMEYHVYGPPNVLHIGWMKLILEYGYDPVTNKIGTLSAQKGVDVFLHNIDVVVPAATKSTYSPAALAQYGTSARAGTSPTRPAMALAPGLQGITYLPTLDTDALATGDYARATYAWESGTPKTIQTNTLQITNSEYSESTDHFHVKYSVGGLTKYWIYPVGQGTYPVLDTLFTSNEAVAGTYFPFVHFRNQQQSMGMDVTSAEYLASVKMMKILGTDYSTLLDAIHENPGVGDVVQAYMTMSVPANSQNQLELEYLFDFFDQQYINQQVALAPVTGLSAIEHGWLKRVTPQHIITIKDTKVSTSLAMVGIFKSRRAGMIGEIGTHTGLLEQSPVEELFFRPQQHVYRRQVATGIYDEIRVVGLSMQYQVVDGYATAADELDDILMIPLDRAITHKYSFRDRETLYSRSLHLVFNSMQIIKVKWYQQEWFGVVLKIAAIAMLIASLGSSINASTAAWTAAETITAMALVVIETIVVFVGKSLLFSYIARLIVQEVGVDAAVILAVIAAVVGGHSVMESGGFKNALPSALQLLSASNSLVNAAGRATQDAILDIYKEMDSLQSQHQKDMQLIEDANKLLEPTSTLEPMLLFGEKPDDYYLRTVHSGNIGSISIDAIHSYVDVMLRPTELSQTFGNWSNDT